MQKILFPKINQVKKAEILHGVKLVDSYRWLEKDDDRTQEWIKEQNIFTRSFLDKISIRAGIKKRLSDLFKIDTVGIPVPRGNRYFFVERKGTEDLGILYTQEGLHGPPRVLVNPNTLSKDKTTVLKWWYPSKDGTLLTYGLSKEANDQVAIYVLNVDTGKNLLDVIPAEIYPHFQEWAPDGKGFWYTRRHPDAPKNEEKFHQKLYFHYLGTDFNKDLMIFGETIAKEDAPGAEISKDGRYLLITVYISSSEKERTDLYLHDRQNPKKGFIPVIKGVDALFYATMHKNTLFIWTNYKAPLWKIMSVGIDKIENGIDKWKIIVPESDHKIEGLKTIKNRLFVETLENVSSRLKVYNLDGKIISEIKLPAIGSLGALTGEKGGNELFFSFSSFFIPHTIYRFDMQTGQHSLFKKADAGIDLDLFTVEQVWYQSKDKTRIPMFLIYKKGLKPNGNNPTMLYGYGGFNISMTPAFNKSIIPFLENGGLYAIANIRGGGEFGEKWHKAGMLDKKQNVFNDFIAASEWLIENKYTNSQRLAIFGWSNGGLLVAVALIQRPELFKAVIIGAPVIDMLRYHKFFGGRHWIQDYGCADNPKHFKYLLKYSPYHNVKDGGHYPAVLTVTADKDDRVHPMHAYKITARLQEANASGNPILLRVETKAGHGGAAPVYRVVDQLTDIWSFVFWQLKMGK